MKKDQKKIPVGTKFIQFGIIFGIFAVLFGWCYQIGVNRPPLKYAFIPESTKDYIDKLGHTPNGQGITYDENGPFEWDNDEDEGKKSSGDWRYEEDANFIVYYHHDREAKWQEYAQSVLVEANNNIAGLIELMGMYMYADDMNGRKLAIYLPETKSLYASTISTLSGESASRGEANSLGITIMKVGLYGCLTKGIVINPIAFEVEPDHINGYVKTLAHEMCHYVFFSALDYGKEIDHYLWVSEGLAEYFCNRYDNRIVHGADSIEHIRRNCLLTGEFSNKLSNSAYWAGESFYRFLEKTHGDVSVKKFVQDAYCYSTDSVFIKEKKSARKTHDKWVEMLKNDEFAIENNDTIDTVQAVNY